MSGNSFTVVVAILGTTISPYLFFWQSNQEVEEIDRKDAAEPAKKAPQQAPKELKRIRLDTFASSHTTWARPGVRIDFWSAVINGFVAVPIMVAMMMVVSRHDRMKEFTAGWMTLVLGWSAAAVMAIAVITLVVP
ncbi:Mn2+/Fe2+ NRAMP family transporter [Pararhizobium capsulatum DSM 1112]|uniref:Mn2+/Fe2+ NRAMP family transporter n=1 Tax=Pararhizobium capsulatum DSM 1112 TaxID=1121113 RepID=A0ABU0BVP1_9HYPH|nr:Mn2+/Fe2+ NRAMP family transporter [Pararhizobium capsulatum DSM 1112]